MKCNIPKQQGKKKPNKIALIKNAPKVKKVVQLGKRLDELEALYKQTTDPEKKAEIKAKMDETHDKIVIMSAEINGECYKKTVNTASEPTKEAGSE